MPTNTTKAITPPPSSTPAASSNPTTSPDWYRASRHSRSSSASSPPCLRNSAVPPAAIPASLNATRYVPPTVPLSSPPLFVTKVFMENFYPASAKTALTSSPSSPTMAGGVILPAIFNIGTMPASGPSRLDIGSCVAPTPVSLVSSTRTGASGNPFYTRYGDCISKLAAALTILLFVWHLSTMIKRRTGRG